MDLSERKKKILQAVVDLYVDSAEPVGSKAIAQNKELSLSSATIRNEMAELEEFGLLMQPHTSAGRIPSQQGFRVYVNSLMNNYRLSLAEMKRINSMLETRISELEKVIERSSKAFSEMTNYAAFATTPIAPSAFVVRLELLPIDQRSVLVVLVLSGGIIKNKILRMNKAVSDGTLRKFSVMLNEKLSFKNVRELGIADLAEAADAMGEYGGMAGSILEFIAESVEEDIANGIFVEGADHLFIHPEFQDIGTARDVISVLQDKKQLSELVGESITSPGIKISIGKENRQTKLSDSSVIMGNYRVGDKVVGAIGIIGPVRMDYSKVVSHMDYYIKTINKLLSDIFDVEED